MLNMPATKKPRTQAQIDATAKLVASNKAKRDAKKQAKPSDESPIEKNVELAINKIVEEKTPDDFAGEPHHVSDASRERAEKTDRRKRSKSSFNYKNKNLHDN